MAKSTAHKALAALKHKLTLATHKLGELANVRAELDLVQRIRSSQSRIIRSQQAELQEFRRGVVVRASEYHKAVEALDIVEVQVTNLQNRNAALRNKIDSVRQSAIVYGTLCIIAAFAAGIATQHWFPISL